MLPLVSPLNTSLAGCIYFTTKGYVLLFYSEFNESYKNISLIHFMLHDMKLVVENITYIKKYYFLK